MDRLKFKPLGLFLAALIFLLVTGCGGLPKETKKKAEAVPQQIADMEKKVASYKTKYESFESSSDFKHFSKYASREKWVGNFALAKAKIANAREIQEKKLKPALDRNEDKEHSQVLAQLRTINVVLNEALDFAKKPGQRIQAFKKAQAEAPKMVEKAKNEMAQIEKVYSALDAFIKASKVEYPPKDKDLTTRFAPIKAVYTKAGATLKQAQKEHSSNNPDYAILVDNCAFMSQNLTKIGNQDTTLRAKISELGKSYSKRLVDMEVRYFVKVGRTSWDNYYEYPTETNHTYTRQVTEDVFEYFGELTVADIATYGYSLRVKINKSMWDNLRISPKERWPSGDDEAGFWLGDVYEEYYHKYILTENGKQRTTGWKKIGADFFESNEGNMDMEIVVKPYGSYESEVVKVAAPPGMAYVNNKKYGRWKKDEKTGRSFWDWYGPYLFYSTMLGGHRHYYYHNDWNTWNNSYRGRRAYYGSNNGVNRYGSSSKYVQKKYAGSKYGKSGGLRQQSSSFRKGGSRRGGGPGKSGK